MLLDYVFIPLFCVIYGTLSLQRALPWMPFSVGAAAVCRRHHHFEPARHSLHGPRQQTLLVFMFVVLIAFIVLRRSTSWSSTGHARIVFASAALSTGRHSTSAESPRATSFAALTYLGFDAVTTLAEDVKNPRRNVLLAAVLRVPVYRIVRRAAGLPRRTSRGRTTPPSPMSRRLSSM